MTTFPSHLRRLLLRDDEVGPAESLMDASAKAHALLLQQQDSWPLLRENYEGLKRTETREFIFDRTAIRVQWNPNRISSTSASVDEASVAKRPCFLCAGNLPREQRALMPLEGFVLLANPFPIFPEHFTIAYAEHIPQRLGGTFRPLLRLSGLLGDRYTLWYNGPACGASAPDHLHFQAGTRGFMPLEVEFGQLRNNSAAVICEQRHVVVLAVEDRLRRFIALESPEEEALASAFEGFLKRAEVVGPDHGEPMMNVMVLYDHGLWRVLLFLRTKHRPSCYFGNEKERLLISPAAVDLGGVVITPRKQDFERITGAEIERIFAEVSISPEKFEELKQQWKSTCDASRGS